MPPSLPRLSPEPSLPPTPLPLFQNVWLVAKEPLAFDTDWEREPAFLTTRSLANHTPGQDLLPRVVGQHKLDVLEAGGENSKLGGQEGEGGHGRN